MYEDQGTCHGDEAAIGHQRQKLHKIQESESYLLIFAFGGRISEDREPQARATEGGPHASPRVVSGTTAGDGSL